MLSGQVSLSEPHRATNHVLSSAHVEDLSAISAWVDARLVEPASETQPLVLAQGDLLLQRLEPFVPAFAEARAHILTSVHKLLALNVRTLLARVDCSKQYRAWLVVERRLSVLLALRELPPLVQRSALSVGLRSEDEARWQCLRIAAHSTIAIETLRQELQPLLTSRDELSVARSRIASH